MAQVKAKTTLSQKILLVSFGIILFFIISETGMRLAGLIISSFQEYRNVISMRQKKAYRIICLGESTTAGGGSASYPAQLEEILNHNRLGIKFSVINKGIPGTSTPYIVSKLEENLSIYKPDMVIAMIGINDFGTHMPKLIVSSSKVVNFISGMRLYKLGKLIQLHLSSKLKKKQIPVKENVFKLTDKYPIDKTRESSSLVFAYENEKNTLRPEDSGEQSAAFNSDEFIAYLQSGWSYIKQEKWLAAEGAFKKALKINPKGDPGLFMGLGQVYSSGEEFIMAQGAYEKSLALDPKNHIVWINLAWSYLTLEKYAQAEKAFRRALQLSPEARQSGTFIGLADIFISQGRLSEAEDSYKKALELNPEDYGAYIKLGWLYFFQQKFLQAKKIFEIGKKLSPKEDFQTYVIEGWLNNNMGNYKEAEGLFLKAINLAPKHETSYIGLAYTYFHQGKYQYAYDTIQKALKFNPCSPQAMGALGVFSKRHGGYGNKLNNCKKFEKSGLQYYYPQTQKNYLKLKSILDQRGIKLICVQYPMRSVKPLKAIFEDKEGILFVDNERVFKDVLKNASYKEYFADMFAGDFGHCTHKGNRLLAENIAKAVMNNFFGENL